MITLIEKYSNIFMIVSLLKRKREKKFSSIRQIDVTR